MEKYKLSTDFIERRMIELLKVRFYKHCLILAEELYRNSEPSKNTPYIGEQRRRRLYGVILFLAFALESFINEIGIKYCRNDFKRIDKISTPDKWILIPKLKSKRIFERNKEPFQAICLIFKYRNLFTHYKPQFKKYDSKEYLEMRKINHSYVRNLYNKSIEAMKIMAKEFNLENSGWLENKKI